MLDLDAIEKEFFDEENASAKLITSAHAVLAELRKCRTAMEEASRLLRGIVAYKPEHDWNIASARNELNEVLRGAK